jgi:hypothetical protein
MFGISRNAFLFTVAALVGWYLFVRKEPKNGKLILMSDYDDERETSVYASNVGDDC